MHFRGFIEISFFYRQKDLQLENTSMLEGSDYLISMTTLQYIREHLFIGMIAPNGHSLLK